MFSETQYKYEFIDNSNRKPTLFVYGFVYVIITLNIPHK